MTLAADWVTISALATAAGTLVLALALATFASVLEAEGWTVTTARHWNIDRGPR